jgi:hypothetical protein
MKHGGPVKGALLTKDGRRILSWGRHELRLWDAVTDEQIGPAMEHDGLVSQAEQNCVIFAAEVRGLMSHPFLHPLGREFMKEEILVFYGYTLAIRWRKTAFLSY